MTRFNGAGGGHGSAEQPDHGRGREHGDQQRIDPHHAGPDLPRRGAGGQPTTLDTNGAGNITFNSPLDSLATENNALIVNTGGTTRFNGLVGVSDRLGSLATDGGGTTVINTSDLRTTGGQTYGDAVLLDFISVTLDSSAAGPITFEGSVDSALAESNGLTVNTAGTTRFHGPVGAATPLASLTTDAAGTTAIHGSSMITAGPRPITTM